MSINTPNKNNLILQKVCFGHHGQISVILQQVRCYLLYKGAMNDEQEKVLLETICCNLKHFLILSKNQDFLPYEKNSYTYYLEKIITKDNNKKLFLDLLSSQILLINEYQCLLKNHLSLPKSLKEQLLIESNACKNALNEQIKA